MKLYRFSPIKSKEEFLEVVKHVHIEAHKLCKNTFEKYLSNTKNFAIFCHYREEFDFLKNLQSEICNMNESKYGKYFKLKEPIIFDKIGDIPETTFTYVYIRKPDPYRSQVGDIDFYLEKDEYDRMRAELKSGVEIKGARIFPVEEQNMIELFDADTDVLSYIVTD